MAEGESTAEAGGAAELSDRLSNAGIRGMLEARFPTQDEGVGLVVGVLIPNHRSIVVLGPGAEQGRGPLDGDTLFEIGSITKVFTALLLADMVRRGEVALIDPVAKYLPAGVKLPEPRGLSITLLDLATHTSGLPFMAGDQLVSAHPEGDKYSAPNFTTFCPALRYRGTLASTGSTRTLVTGCWQRPSPGEHD